MVRIFLEPAASQFACRGTMKIVYIPLNPVSAGWYFLQVDDEPIVNG